METEAIRVAVVMQRKCLNNRWQPYTWLPQAVVHDAGCDIAPLCLSHDLNQLQWQFAGLEVRLYSDEAEGYFLNATSPAPCWFIMWRLETVGDEELAVPKAVTLSYNEAARMMDAGEQVDTLPLEERFVEHLHAFTAEYYRPEPRKKQRKPSFEGGAAVEQMAKAEGVDRGR